MFQTSLVYYFFTRTLTGRICGFCFGKTAIVPRAKAVLITSVASIMIIFWVRALLYCSAILRVQLLCQFGFGIFCAKIQGFSDPCV